MNAFQLHLDILSINLHLTMYCIKITPKYYGNKILKTTVTKFSSINDY